MLKLSWLATISSPKPALARWSRLHNKLVLDGAGASGQISCPAHDCDASVSLKSAEKYISAEVARKYLKVAQTISKKWCPRQGCQRAVSLPEGEHLSPRPAVNGRHTLQTLTGVFQVPSVSHSVDCGGWHY